MYILSVLDSWQTRDVLYRAQANCGNDWQVDITGTHVAKRPVRICSLYVPLSLSLCCPIAAIVLDVNPNTIAIFRITPRLLQTLLLRKDRCTGKAPCPGPTLTDAQVTLFFLFRESIQ